MPKKLTAAAIDDLRPEPQTVQLAVSELVDSPINVRQGPALDPKDPADAEFIQCILAEGVNQNILVGQAGKGKYFVFAGKRRVAAVRELIKRGDVAEPYYIDARILAASEPEYLEASLQENLQRKALHPVDEYKAFAHLVELGMSVEEIANRFGRDVRDVTRRMRLGSVHPTILEAWRAENGRIHSQSTIECFAATADQNLQLKVFKQITKDAGYLHPQEIRDRILGQAIDGDHHLVKYVGLKAYEKAGGALIKDLFTEHTYIQDIALLERLAQQKLDRTVKNLQREGYKFVEAELEGPRYGVTLPAKYVRSDSGYDFPEAFAKRLQEAQAQFEAADAAYEQAADRAIDETGEFIDGEDDDAPDYLKEANQACQEAQDTIIALEQEQEQYRRELPKEETGAYVTVDAYSGKAKIVRGIVPRASQAAADNAPKPRYPDKVQQDLDKIRGVAWRQALYAARPAVAELLMTFAVVDLVLGPLTRSHVSVLMGDDSVSRAADGLCRGQVMRGDIAAELPLEWASENTVAKQFAAFAVLPEDDINRLRAFAMGELMGHWHFDALAEVLVPMIGTPRIMQAWRPNDINLFERLRKEALLEIGGEIAGEDWPKKNGGAKKPDLVKAVDHLATANRWMPAEVYNGLDREGDAS